MKKTTKLTIAGAITLVALTGMVAARKAPNGQINFTDNIVAKAVTSGYQQTEDFAIHAWKKTEAFFVGHSEE